MTTVKTFDQNVHGHCKQSKREKKGHFHDLQFKQDKKINKPRYEAAIPT